MAWCSRLQGKAMASFNREDYERVFRFAVWVYKLAAPASKLRRECVAVMNMIEDCIGQMDRPDRKKGKG